MPTTYTHREHGRLLTPEGACERLREEHAIERSARTLGIYRVRGEGPQFIKVGHAVRYPEKLLDAWAHALNAVPIRDITDVRVGSPVAITAATAIRDLPIPVGTRNALLRAGLETASQLQRLDDQQLRKIPHVGERGLAAIRALLPGPRIAGA
jgi:hypothetical protein